MTRSEIIADHIATLRNLVLNSDATTARLAFVRAIYAALATPGCEAQGVRLVDLPHLAERVAEMADAHERVVGERDAARKERDEARAEVGRLAARDELAAAWCPTDGSELTSYGRCSVCGYEDRLGFGTRAAAGVKS